MSRESAYLVMPLGRTNRAKQPSQEFTSTLPGPSEKGTKLDNLKTISLTVWEADVLPLNYARPTKSPPKVNENRRISQQANADASPAGDEAINHRRHERETT